MKLKPPVNNLNKKNIGYSFNSNITPDMGTELLESVNSNEATPNIFEEPVNSAYNAINLMYPAHDSIDIDIDLLDEAPNDWNFFPLPDIETLKRITKSIYSQGQLSPAIVWEKENERFMILSGHTRFRIMKFLITNFPEEANRFSKMRCHVYAKDQITEDDAKYIIISSNMTQRAQESIKVRVKSVVAALELQKKITPRRWGKSVERSNSIVAKSFGIGARTVDRLYRLRKLIPELLEDLSNELFPRNTALTIAELDEDLQKYIHTMQFHRNYLTSHQLSLLKCAKTKEDINKALSSYIYTCPGAQIVTSTPVPKDFERFSIAVNKNDIDIVKSKFKEVLNSIEFSDPNSKTLLLEMLSR